MSRSLVRLGRWDVRGEPGLTGTPKISQNESATLASMGAAAEARRTDEEWMRALAPAGSGSAPSAESLAAQNDLHGLVLAGLRKALSVQDEATLDDLTQIAVLRIVEKLDRFEGRSRFTTWAYSVALRAALTELRKAAPERSHVDVADTDVAADGSDADAPAERAEIVEVLHQVIASALTERQRRAILGELRGESIATLAEELGSNQNAMYKLMHDARAKLRDGLEEAGISDEEVREAFGL